MAEVSNLHRFQVQTTITGIEAFDFESFSPPNASFLIDSGDFTNNDEAFHLNHIQQMDYGFESVHSDPNFFVYGQGDEDDQLNFVTDLFESHRALTDSPEHPDLVFGSVGVDEEPELGLDSEFDRFIIPSMSGLRVVDMDSESDSEAVEVDSGLGSISNYDGFDSNCDLDVPDFWNCLQVHSNRPRFSEEFEWEEVNERENLSSVIGRIEEISVSSNGENLHIDSEAEQEEEENVQNLEWQVLLAVHDLELDLDAEFENNAPLGEFVDIDVGRKGSPPAAKSVLENLPLVILTTEDLRTDKVICAVCKDDVNVGEEVTRLPCSHHYHEDCIVPWLSIRNTCPVCRYELPTDDVDYEETKNGAGDGNGFRRVSDLQVRYNYQLLP